jgi:hypothetical protein
MVMIIKIKFDESVALTTTRKHFVELFLDDNYIKLLIAIQKIIYI